MLSGFELYPRWVPLIGRITEFRYLNWVESLLQNLEVKVAPEGSLRSQFLQQILVMEE